MIFVHLIMALITPNGRISQMPFAILCILLAFGHLWAFSNIFHNNLGVQWNIYTVALFAMLWMQFCVFTRRSRDTGSSGALYIPVLFIAAAIFLLSLDADTMWPSAGDTFVGDIATRWGMRILRLLYIAMFIYGLRAPSQTGPNGYGPEFGETTDSDRAGRIMDHRLAAQAPINRYGRISKKAPAWGERRRKGFGRR